MGRFALDRDGSYQQVNTHTKGLTAPDRRYRYFGIQSHCLTKSLTLTTLNYQRPVDASSCHNSCLPETI